MTGSMTFFVVRVIYDGQEYEVDTTRWWQRNGSDAWRARPVYGGRVISRAIRRDSKKYKAIAKCAAAATQKRLRAISSREIP